MHHLSISLHKTLTNNPIKVLSVAKTTEIDDFKWSTIFSYIRKSLIGFSIKLVICHGLVQIPEIGKRKSIIERKSIIFLSSWWPQGHNQNIQSH